MKTQMQTNRIVIRFFAAFLAVVMVALTLPIISFAEDADTGTTVSRVPPIQPIALGSIPSEDYYRLLYANDVALYNDVVYKFEETGFDFEKVSYNDTLTKSFYYANLGLKVLSFAPYIGGFAKALAGFTNGPSGHGVIYKVSNNTKDMVNQLGGQLESLYASIAADLDKQTEIMIGKMNEQASYITDTIKNSNYEKTIKDFHQEKFDVNNKKGYYNWKKELYTLYDQLLSAQEEPVDPNSKNDPVKVAFDRLYVAAIKVNDLTAAMTGGEFAGDYSIQEVMLYYNLHRAQSLSSVSMDEAVNECVAFTEDLYTTYLFANTCLATCYQYQISELQKEKGYALKNAYYELGAWVNSMDGMISYTTTIKPYVDEGLQNVGEMEAEIARYYVKLLNLCESYQINVHGETSKVLYNQIVDDQIESAVVVSREGTDKKFVVINNRVVKSDVLYLNTIPKRLAASFTDVFTFESSDASIASVTNEGVVTVLKEGDFSITMKYGDTPIYRMSFTSKGGFSGGLGSSSSPYLISTAADLKNLASNSKYWAKGYHYKMTADISVDALTQINDFQGVFDGDGHTISGLSGQSHAIFAWNNGTIKNLTVKGAKVTGGGYLRAITLTVGGVCNVNMGTIDNVHFVGGTVNVTNTAAQSVSAGGDSYYTQAGLYVGGITGENNGTIRRCSVTGATVKGSQTNGTKETSALGVAVIGAPSKNAVYLGNIAGANAGTTEDCVASGNTDYAYIKSVSGYSKNLWTEATESLCTAYFYMGGLFGSNTGTVNRCLVYSNSITKGWDKSTVNYVTGFWNDEKNLENKVESLQALIGSGSGSKCFTSVSISDADKQVMIAAGWEWDSTPTPNALISKSVSIAKRPNTTVYDLNDVFNPAGLVLKTDDGQYIANGYTLSGFDSSSYGKKTVTVNWAGLTATFDVHIRCQHDEVEISDVMMSEDKAEYRSVSCKICDEELFKIEDQVSEVTVAPPANSFTLTAESKQAKPGDTVKVVLDLANNPGVAYLRLTVKYDTAALTLKTVENGSIISDLDQGVNLVWSADSNSSANGTLVTLTFEVKENAAVGDYTVDLVLRECYDETYNSVPLYTVDGVIEVVNATVYGDVNGDETVDGKDVLILRKYMSNYNDDTQTSTVTVSEGADANGDGKIDGRDLLLLRKYMANYDDDLGSSTIVLGPAA